MLAMGVGWGRALTFQLRFRRLWCSGHGVHHLPGWGWRGCVTASTACLPPPLLYCTIPEALWGRQVTHQPHLREGGGKLIS
jgi:hypothetical protein